MTDAVKTAERGNGLGGDVRQVEGADGQPLHENWLELMRYCEQRRYVSMRLNVADGVPVSAEEVVPHIKFGKGKGRRHLRPVEQ